jgi:hypothetical protein
MRAHNLQKELITFCNLDYGKPQNLSITERTFTLSSKVVMALQVPHRKTSAAICN